MEEIVLDQDQWGITIELPDNVHIDLITDDELICVTEGCQEHG